MFGAAKGAYRCSTCALNFPGPGECQVCKGKLDYMANAKVTKDLNERIYRLLYPPDVVDEKEKVFLWRRDELFAAGCPWDYAVKLAKDRDFELGKTRAIFRESIKKHGTPKGVDLALDILL